MSFPDAEGSDRSAIPGRPIAGVDGANLEKKICLAAYRYVLVDCLNEIGLFHDSNKSIFLKAVYLFSSRNDMIQYFDSYY